MHEAARATEWQREGAHQLQRAARAAEESASAQRQTRDLQEQALQEQRRATFALWRQTPDGEAFNAWMVRALDHADAYDRKTSEFEAVWKAERQRAFDAITEDEQRRFATGVHLDGKPTFAFRATSSVYLGAVVLVVVAAILFLIMGVGALFGRGHPWFGLEWPVVPLALGLVLIVWGKVLSLRHPEWRDEDHAKLGELERWKYLNDQAGKAAAEERVTRFGFDPLADPSWRPEPWTADSPPRDWVNSFIVDAVTQLPSARELPPLVAPKVRDVASERVPRLRSELRKLEEGSR